MELEQRVGFQLMSEIVARLNVNFGHLECQYLYIDLDQSDQAHVCYLFTMTFDNCLV